MSYCSSDFKGIFFFVLIIIFANDLEPKNPFINTAMKSTCLLIMFIEVKPWRASFR